MFDEEHLDDHYECQREVAERDARIRELEACVLEYWHAKDWAAVGAADFMAAKLLTAEMKARAACATKGRGDEHEAG